VDNTVTIYTMSPSDNSDFKLDLILLSLMMIGLLLFVITMTRLRKRRYNTEKSNFSKLLILQENDPKITADLLRF